jgi:hypothetical protein
MECTTMKATDESTPTTLLDIQNRLDLEIDFARGVVTAIHGLDEYLNNGAFNGVVVLAEAHIERLEAISAELTRFRDAARAQAMETATTIATH